MGELKDSGLISLMAYKAINELGHDAAHIFQRCGLTLEQLEQRDARIPHDGQQMFWRVLEEETGDPHIGIHLGKHLSIFKGQVLEYLFLSSANFLDGLTRASNFMRLLGDSVSMSLMVEQNDAAIVFQLSEVASHHTNEAGSQALIRFFSGVTEGSFKATRIVFSHTSTLDIEEYESIFGCPVELNGEENRIYFSREVLRCASAHAEPELLKLHEDYAQSFVNKLEKQDLVLQVNKVIAELLESGEADLESVAEKLQLKPRNLRSRLTAANTNFNQVLADYRCYLAKRLLARTSETIDEIVYLTGFSEPSTFYRAFKRWVGMTPIEYRKSKAKT